MASTLSGLLEKAENRDSDIRFMAMSDMKVLLEQEEFKLEAGMDTRVTKMMVKMLDDQNGDVQQKAVQCLPLLVKKISGALLTDIISPLSDHLLTGDERQRDIASIALKDVINHIPMDSPNAQTICSGLMLQIVTALGQDNVEDNVVLEMLGVMHDILLRFGKPLQSLHGQVQEILFKHLSHQRMAVRKRTVVALGCLVGLTGEDIYVELMNFVSKNLSAMDSSGTDQKTMVELTTAICREAGARFAPYLKDVLPHIKVMLDSEDDDELRDCCIQSFSSFAMRCQKEFAGHIDELVELCLKYLQHDPNYNYDSDSDDDMDEENSDDDDDDDFEDEYSDDDDVTWKVRRSAAHFFNEIIETRPAMLKTMLIKVSPALVRQFREREESVRIEIFMTYRALLQQARATTSTATMDPEIAQHIMGPIPQIVKSLAKQTKDKNMKIRLGLLGVFKEIALTARGALAQHFDVLVPATLRMLSDKQSSSNVKLEALSLLQRLMDNNDSAPFHPLVPQIASALSEVISDTFYKIAAEGLATANKLFTVMRPQSENPLSPELKAAADSLFKSVFDRFSATDIDQEVKEQAIKCAAQVVHTLADVVDCAPSCLPIMLTRLQNEGTRIVTTNAIAHIASSPLHIDLKPILKDTYLALASFLRKNSRSLRVSALVALEILVSTYDDVIHSQLCGLLQNMGGVDNPQTKRRRVHSPNVTDLEVESFTIILSEIPPLIDVTDLTTTQYSISLVTSILRIHRPLASKLESEIELLPKLLELSTSPILQGSALDALCSCLKTLATSAVPCFSVANLLKLLLEPIYTPTNMEEDGQSDKLVLPRQSFSSLARCAATLAALNTTGVLPLVSQFISDISNIKSSVSIRLLSLLAVGEIGKDFDLSANTDILKTISTSFGSVSEHVKSAATYALGNVACGNLTLFLPTLLNDIRSHPAHQYLLVQSLKEMIASKANSTAGVQSLAEYVNDIWSLLMEYSDGTDEGLRGVVAESLGKIVLVDADLYLNLLEEQLASPSASVRCTSIQAFKFTVSVQQSVSDALLKTKLPKFLSYINDSDLMVRCIALVTFNSVVHNKAHLVKPLLKEVLPLVYKETIIRKDLIRIVEMGPFKQNFDDGLDARKSAFEACHTLLESCSDTLQLPQFVMEISKGLEDQHDIQMLTHLMIQRLATKFPTALLIGIPVLCDHIDKILSEKIKNNDVKVNKEKAEERKRAGVKTARLFTKIAGSEEIHRLAVLVERINADLKFSEMFEEIPEREDSANRTKSGGVMLLKKL
eukprot:m.112749 g.112749  ORF g.112749 m.112749 type:complete len:1275 (-) comp28217_c0_seq1:74-3898(-)